MRLLNWLTLTAAAVSGYAAYRHRQRERALKNPARKPEPLQRWEGEGGALPVKPKLPAAADDVGPAGAVQAGPSLAS